MKKETNGSSSLPLSSSQSAPFDVISSDTLTLTNISGVKHEDVLNSGTEDETLIRGFALVRKWYRFQWVLTVLTVGILQLVFFWRRDWQLKFTHRRVPLSDADHILAKSNDDRISAVVCKVYWLDVNSGHLYRHRPKHASVSNGNGKLNEAVQFDSIEGANGNGMHSYKYLPDLVRFFEFQKLRYIWDEQTGRFTKLLPDPLARETPCSYFYEIAEAGGRTEEEARKYANLFGVNAITIHVTPILNLLIHEILGPFYVFQLFAIILWYCTEYYYYASCIVLMSALSAGLAVYVTRKAQRTLQRTVHGVNKVKIIRNNVAQDVNSDLLVPGDLIEIPSSDWVVTCDAVLISGECLMSESMLTGESTPTPKTALPNQANRSYSMVEHNRHLLSGGTLVIQSKRLGSDSVRAVVLRTGWATRKGELVRSILFPKPFGFHFTRHSYYFVMCLGALGVCTFAYTWVVYAMQGMEAGLIANKGLSMITIVVPPALPAAMTTALVLAQRRLKKKGIFSISQKYILVCGAINALCFDKTGTLTEDGLDVWGVLPCKEASFGGVVNDTDTLPEQGPLVSCMAMCHSLTYVDGKLIGEPLDFKMYSATRWKLEDLLPGDPRSQMCSTVAYPSSGNTKISGDHEEGSEREIGLVRQFAFESSLQRMSVVAIGTDSGRLMTFAKGSPEKIRSLCDPSSIPSNFDSQLMYYAAQGHRIIALAWKKMPNDMSLSDVRASSFARDVVECDLKFLGLLIMENRLKKATIPTLLELRNAAIRTIMVTGDNLHTALTVAHKCAMLSDDDQVFVLEATAPQNDGERATLNYSPAHFSEDSMNGQFDDEAVSPRFKLALSGESWRVVREYFPDIIPQVVVRGVVFARMAPEQKAQLVEALQAVDYYVAMCGDGANDCGALKAAHTGCSLSEAEASVASPFTSKVQDISCMPALIKEGRCTLVGSFGVFKLMLLYSFSQLVAACFVYWTAQDLGPQQYLWEDLFGATTLVITFCWTEPHTVLVKIRPPTSLIGFTTLFEMAIHMILLTFFQGFAYLWTLSQPWSFTASYNIDPYISQTNRAVFQLSVFQIIIFAVVVAHSHPYRKSIFTNYLFLANVGLLLVADVLIFMLINYDPDVLSLANFPSYMYRFDLILLALANFFVCYIFEQFFMESKPIKKCIKAIQTCQCTDKPRYLTEHSELDSQMSENPKLPRSVAELPDYDDGTQVVIEATHM